MRVLLLIVSLIAAALTTDAQVRRASAAAALSDEQIQRLLRLAIDNIGRGLCEDKKPCAPATAEEQTNPPITIAEARLVVHRGAISATAEQCGLDWRGRNYLPMMAYWRHKTKKSERQMTLIALLHGIMQGMSKPGSKTACTEEMRQNVDRQLTFRP